MSNVVISNYTDIPLETTITLNSVQLSIIRYEINRSFVASSVRLVFVLH